MGVRAPSVAIGERFGRLTVLAEDAPRLRSNGRYQRRSLCGCDCGETKAIQNDSLRSGKTTSCGCLQRERAAEAGRGSRRHGHTPGGQPSRTYRSWTSMKSRCADPGATGYERYGGRGVTFCERWSSFDAFLEDMGERPDGMSLDRIDPEGNYEPQNCRWATALEQRHNRRGAVR